VPDEPKPFHNPFAALRSLRGPEQPAVQPPAVPAEGAAKPAVAAAGKSYPRAVVRMERAGRGGKEVTVVEQLALAPAEREQWLKALKGSLGCGGTVEGETLVLQGDQRKRLSALLTARGVKKVTVG
jgi:translation initiation factor 1